MVAPNKPRKKSRRTKGKRIISAASARLKELWQTPEFRERMRLRNEAIAADQKANPEKYKRTGIPDGMTRKKAQRLWTRAYKLADRFIQVMKDTGQLPEDEKMVVMSEDGAEEVISVPATDAGKAEAALREVFALAIGPSTQQIKIQACNTVLAYTKSKPESKSKLTLNKAEDFLDQIANDGNAD